MKHASFQIGNIRLPPNKATPFLESCRCGYLCRLETFQHFATLMHKTEMLKQDGKFLLGPTNPSGFQQPEERVLQQLLS